MRSSWQATLAEISRRNLSPNTSETLTERALGGGIVNEGQSECCRNSFSRLVITRWPEPACGHNEICFRQSTRNFLGDGDSVVTHD